MGSGCFRSGIGSVFGLMSGETLAKDVKELKIGIGIDADSLNPV